MLRIALAGGRFQEARSHTAAFLYRQSPSSTWRSSIKSVVPMRSLLFDYRKVELELRNRSSDGSLPERTRAALMKRYSRFADVYFDLDKESFRQLMQWLKELGVEKPTNLTPRLQALSEIIGYENALRLRSTYRTKIKPFMHTLLGKQADAS